MRYTANILRGMLGSMIRKMGEDRADFVRNPGRDFTRRRTLTFETVITLLLTMGERSVGKELMGWFKLKARTPSASAFLQQRQKLLPLALETLYHRFTDRLHPTRNFRGYRLLAVDGADLKSDAWPDDLASYRSGTDRQHGWNLWHMNVLFDLENSIYTDLVVQKEHEKNERKALCQMVDRSPISGKVILLADRNYEACNDLAHLERKGWNYLIRIRDKDRAVAYGVKLPDQPSFDIPVHITLGRLTKRQLEAQGIAVPEHYYRLPPSMTFDFLPLGSSEFYLLSFRIVRLVRNDGSLISFLTNLAQDDFPLSELKRLYARRWGVETSFRSLKYTVGLIHLHSKKPDLVLQEIFSAFLIFNFAQAAVWADNASCAVSNYKRHINFSDAVFACCLFLRGPHPDPLPLLRRKLLPFRPDRSRPRPKLARNCMCACYASAR